MALHPALAALVFGIGPSDPATLAGATAVLLAVSLGERPSDDCRRDSRTAGRVAMAARRGFRRAGAARVSGFPSRCNDPTHSARGRRDWRNAPPHGGR